VAATGEGLVQTQIRCAISRRETRKASQVRKFPRGQTVPVQVRPPAPIQLSCEVSDGGYQIRRNQDSTPKPGAISGTHDSGTRKRRHSARTCSEIGDRSVGINRRKARSASIAPRTLPREDAAKTKGVANDPLFLTASGEGFAAIKQEFLAMERFKPVTVNSIFAGNGWQSSLFEDSTTPFAARFQGLTRATQE